MKSKMNIKSIIIMFSIAVISMFFINMSFAANTGKVSVETANLRESANESSKILELISINEEVEIIEKTSGWYKIKYKGITGYLREDLVTADDKTQKSETNTNNNITFNTNIDENVEANENTTTDNNTNLESQTIAQNNNQEQNQPVEEQIPIVETEEQLGKYKILENTNLKIIPTINATNITEVKKDEEVNATEIINGWTCVETTSSKGWLRLEKLSKPETTENQKQEQETEMQQQEQQQEQQPTETEEQKQPIEQPEEKIQNTTKKQYINSTSVNLRREPNTNCEVIASLTINKEVEVISEENGWSKVKADGMEGYISTSLLSNTMKETSRGMEDTRKPVENNTQKTNTTEEVANTSTPTNGSAILATANQYLGAKYVYGGSSPATGFDCSGFTSYVFKQHGVNLNRTAAGQYSNGVAVNKSDLQIGDLVMFGKSGINHVGIYMGGGKIIHAANPSRGVTTDTINSGYYNTNYVGARRVL